MRSVEASRLDCLVFLRVVATLAVVFGHAVGFRAGAILTQWPNFPYLQSTAVSIFFAVSGWTIAWVLETREASYGRFAYDRFTRLLIPLAPVLVALAIVELTHFRGGHPYPGTVSVTDFAGNLVFLQDLQLHLPFLNPIDLGVEPYSLELPLWTIAREFWIYLAFGGLFLALRGKRVASGPAGPVVPAIGALLASLLVADCLFGGRGSGLGLVWLAGAGLYWVQRGVGVLSGRRRLVLVPVQAFLVYCLFDRTFWPASGTYSMTWNMVLFGNFACFMFLAPGLRVPAAALRLVTFFGAFAYTTYLVHYPVLFLTDERGIEQGWPALLLMCFASLAVAWLVSLVFEQRYRVIRDAVWNGAARAVGARRHRPAGEPARHERHRSRVH